MYDTLFRLADEPISDWSSWVSRFQLAIVQSNSSQAIQSVVNENPGTASELFLISFHALWNDSKTPTKLTKKICDQFVSILPICPPSVVEMILNIVEHTLVHGGSPIPIPIPLLARAAEQALFLPASIFFREQELRETAGLPSSECVESLIGLNIKLDIKDSAHGLLRSSIAEYIKVRPEWHERLENWQSALTAYSVQQLTNQTDRACTQGRLRCLAALGEWERILAISPLESEQTANACLNLQKWDQLDIVVQNMKTGNFEEKILAIANGIKKNCDVSDLFNDAYAMIGGRLVAQAINPSNTRMYLDNLKRLQLELLEDISGLEKRAFMEKWNQQLLQLDYSLEVWTRLIPLRSLLLDPYTEDIDTWIKFSTLARKKQNLNMSTKIVERLLQIRGKVPEVILSGIKNTYVGGNREGAMKELENFVLVHQDDVNFALIAKCYHALAMWTSHYVTNRDPYMVSEFLRKSISLDPNNYKAWSSYALEKFKQTKEMGFGISHVSETIRALTRCIELGPTQVQDVLRFLSLWFTYYGKDSEIDFQFNNVMERVGVEVWIPALPQILARLRSRRAALRDVVRSLVLRIGLHSPQSVVFPLAVLSQSDNSLLSTESQNILSSIRSSFPQLVSECELISTELVRITATWFERWAAWLEEASRLYFVEKKEDEMIVVLESAYESTASPSTPSERAFVVECGPLLSRAKDLLNKHKIEDMYNLYLMEAWRIYYEVFQRLHEMNAATSQLNLESVSPALYRLQNCCVGIPERDSSRIHSFSSVVEILPSKQKPRVVNIIGTDGHVYKYLLKGNEDLKQDERVMQLFKLVNSVVSDAVDSRRRSGVFPSTPGIETLEHVELRRYAVIPLSNNTGLIEWVPTCETLHSLIKQFRETNSVPVAVEHNIMRAKYTKYEQLLPVDKLCIFEHALKQTEGMDLARMMFINAGNCDKWLKARLMYSRSLAMTSIVGYVLGLGDRHPSNLMIDRESGQVVHVDFGDCFDVTFFRDRYPEKIPFRLTRQLINALEVAGLEGTFRITCERVMDLIRNNRDTVMAMLEAFIYDPLVTWRLLPSGGGIDEAPTSLSWQARAIIDRVNAKIVDGDSPIPVQVDRLIREATAHENLCSLYLGYCAFW